MKKTILFSLILTVLLYTASLAAYSQESPELREGMKLFYAKDLEKAKECFHTAFQNEPNNSLPLLFLLDCYAQEKNLQPILNELEEAALEKSGSAVAKAHLGFGYFAMSLLKNDVLEESMAQFKEALKLDSELSMGYLGMGIVYYKKRMIPRSRSYFFKAIKLNPKDVISLERLGEINLVDDKNPQAARNLFEQIISLYPNYPDGYFYFASASQEMGEYEIAIENFQKTMELDPTGMGNGYYAPQRIGDIYYKLKNYPKAIEYYERSLKINPENSYSKTMLEKAKNPTPEEDKSKGEDKGKGEDTKKTDEEPKEDTEKN